MRNLKIRFRLYIVLSVSILAVALVAVYGIININRLSTHITTIDTSNVEPLNKLVRMTHYFDTLRSYLRDAVITPDPAKTAEHLDTVLRLYAQLTEISDAYLAHMVAGGITSGHEYNLIRAFVTELPGAAEIVLKVADRASDNDQANALRLIEEECVPYNTRMSNYLTDLAVFNSEQSERMAADARQSASTALTTMVLISTVSVVALLVLIGVITGSITGPLRKLQDASKQLEAGNLNIQLDTAARDETGELARMLSGVAATLHNIISNIGTMYREHEQEGNISYTIDTSAFVGSYKEVTDGVNQMVASYVNTCQDILKTMEDIAKGDMAIKLPTYKGKKAEINQTVNKVVTAIKDVAETIGTLAKAGAAGNLTAKADTAKFDGEWANIARDMNALMDAFGGAISDTVTALGELSHGNFTHRITASYKGEYEKIKVAANHTSESINSYIKEMSSVLENVARGDLTHRIQREYAGDFTAIKVSINQITETLNETIHNISSASEQVLAGSTQISQSATMLAQGAAQQAGSIQELTANIDEINEQTQENAANSQQASSLAKSSKDSAQTGNVEMSALLEAMDGIKKSSNEISYIIKTIEDIAFQTNLLALNASVESARAGEHGRGFTVVAEEVRALAAKSREAVQNTSMLIRESIERVNDGTRRANDTANSLAQIVENVAEVSEVINKIYEASKSQAESIKSVNAGTNEIAQVVQSNTATSQQSAASAQELNAQAVTLKQMISFFRTA